MNTKLYTTMIASKKAHVILMTLGTVFVLVVVFQAGVQVGYRQASFAFGSGDNYYRMFGAQERRGPDMSLPMPMQGRLPASHGAIGTIVSAAPPTLIVAGKDGTEQTVRLRETTLIRKNRETLSQNDLHEGDFIVVVGAPNTDAEIDARFVRIMPKPPDIPSL